MHRLNHFLLNWKFYLITKYWHRVNFMLCTRLSMDMHQHHFLLFGQNIKPEILCMNLETVNIMSCQILILKCSIIHYVWRGILQVISSITTTKNRNLRKQTLIEETWAFWILRDFQLNYLPNWFGLVLWCQTGDYSNTWGGMVAQWQRAWLLSCSPRFKSGVFPAHSWLPIFWWVATWDGTWLRADLCEGDRGENYEKWTAGTPKT